MKRMFCLVLLAALGGICFGEELFAPAVVTADDVNLRAGPSLRAEIVGQVFRAQPVNVIASDAEWCAIAPPPGVVAWVSADYLKAGEVTADRVNVRSGPGLAYARLTQLSAGARPEVLEQQEKWVKISMPSDVTLWVNARYVELAPPPPDAVAPLPPGPAEETVSPSAHLRPPPGTPFSPRSAPAYTPAALRALRSRTGVIRELPSSREVEGETVTYELVRTRPRIEVIANLTGRTLDLSKYQNRRVRIWAEEISRPETALPLWEVKGVQVLW